jgi:Cys-tRNA(Pro)/Cys-tRNA(Cys) deacylase
MEYTTPVSNALDAAGIPYRLFKHQGAIRSLEQAAEERGQRPEQVVRSILFRLGEGEFAMVLMAGAAQVSWPALRRYFGQSRLTMASEEEVKTVTGYERGALSPVGIPQTVRLLVDESVLAEEEISIGSGVRGITVILNSQDLLAFLKSYETGGFQQA